VRLWDLHDALTFKEEELDEHSGLSVAIGRYKGRDVVVSGEKRRVRLLDLVDGAPVCSPFTIPDDVESVAADDIGDRSIIAAGGYYGSIRAWEADRQELVNARVGEGINPFRAIAVANYGGSPILVSADAAGQARVWNLRTGQQMGPEFQPASGGKSIEALIAIEDGPEPTVISAGGIYNIVSWRISVLPDGRTTAETIAIGKEHRDYVRCLAVGIIPKQGRVLVSGSDDKSVRLWFLPSLRPIGDPLKGHRNWVTGVGITTLDGQSVVVSSGRDGLVCIWSPDGELLHRIQLDDSPRGFAVGPTGTIVIGTELGPMVIQLRQ
jgi:WD40 repeat protein